MVRCIHTTNFSRTHLISHYLYGQVICEVYVLRSAYQLDDCRIHWLVYVIGVYTYVYVRLHDDLVVPSVLGTCPPSCKIKDNINLTVY